MPWTRISFFYLIGYLSVGGLGLLAMPLVAVRLLFGTGEYDPELLRLVGGLMVALAIVIGQIVRHRVEVLYRTTLVVRVFLVSVLAWLHARTADPLFLVIALIVVVGILMTTAGIVADRRAARR